MNTVVVLPLTRLADQIRDDLSRREHGRDEWIAATLDLCRHLAEARGQFQADRNFHKWLTDNQLGDEALNAHDRAAAIDMGQHIEEARAVLAKTERRSLQLIHREEFRSANASKPANRNRATQKHRNPAITPEAEQLLARAVLDDGMTLDTAAAEFGLGSMQVAKIAVAKERGRREAKGEPQLDALVASLPPSTRARYDAAVRQMRKELEFEIGERVRQQHWKIMEEVMLPQYRRDTEDARRVLAARNGVMTRAQYRKMLACLHPDRSMGQEALMEAFNFFKTLELVLVAEAELPRVSNAVPLPTTREEMLKRREEVRMRKVKR
jgi:hypothetical protein